MVLHVLHSSREVTESSLKDRSLITLEVYIIPCLGIASLILRVLDKE